jgi:chromate transporter
LAIYIGYRLAGLRGLFAAGACFIAPTMLIMLGLAWVYTQFSRTAWLAAILLGVRPVVTAIIAWVAIDLARKTVERRWLLLLAPVFCTPFLVWAQSVAGSPRRRCSPRRSRS